MNLPNRYNTFTRALQNDRTKLLETMIYHYSGHDYSFDPSNRIHKLFLEYLMKTPFFDVDALLNLTTAMQKNRYDLITTMRKISNQLAHKSRIFLANSKDLERIQNLFEATSSAIFFRSENPPAIDTLTQALKSKNYFCLVFDFQYESIREKLISEGFVENVDFCNAMIFVKNTFDDRRFAVDLINSI